MQVNLREPLLLCQDSYLGNIYLDPEIYDSRHSVVFALATGFPSAGAAPPGIGKRLESHVGQTAHHGTNLSSPGAENCRRPAARATPAAHPDPPFGRSTDGRTDDHVAAPNGGYRARRVGRSRRSCGAIRPEELVRHLALPGHQGPAPWGAHPGESGNRVGEVCRMSEVMADPLTAAPGPWVPVRNRGSG